MFSDFFLQCDFIEWPFRFFRSRNMPKDRLHGCMCAFLFILWPTGGGIQLRHSLASLYSISAFWDSCESLARRFHNQNSTQPTGSNLAQKAELACKMTTENVSLNASFGNQTLHEQFGQLRHLSIMGYAILMSVSGVENITILFLLSVRRPMSRITLLLISLTVSDLLVTFLTMPLEIAWAYTVQWLAEDWVCKVMMVGRIFGLYSSSFNLVAISIDRFCIIL